MRLMTAKVTYYFYLSSKWLPIILLILSATYYNPSRPSCCTAHMGQWLISEVGEELQPLDDWAGYIHVHIDYIVYVTWSVIYYCIICAQITCSDSAKDGWTVHYIASCKGEKRWWWWREEGAVINKMERGCKSGRGGSKKLSLYVLPFISYYLWL